MMFHYGFRCDDEDERLSLLTMLDNDGVTTVEPLPPYDVVTMPLWPRSIESDAPGEYASDVRWTVEEFARLQAERAHEVP